MTKFQSLLFLFSFVLLKTNATTVAPKETIEDVQAQLNDLTDQFNKHLKVSNDANKKLDDILTKVKSISTCDQNWIPYSDQKCLLVIDSKRTQTEAVNDCHKLDSSSTLVAIHSKEEQDFIFKMISKFSNTADNAWIGLQYINKTNKWMDGTEVNYNNWSDGMVRADSNTCSVMSLTKSESGKWSDYSCLKKSLVICQSMQSNIKALKEYFNKHIIETNTKIKVLENKVQSQELLINDSNSAVKKLETKVQSLQAQGQDSNTIPIGFLYTQLPNQSEPSALWPKTKWSEVTEQYAGLFFRAEGKSSDKFGLVQNANYTRHYFKTSPITIYNGLLNKDNMAHIYTEGKEGKWTDDLLHPIGSTSYTGLSALQIYSTKAENIPKNTAIRIWKRTK